MIHSRSPVTAREQSAPDTFILRFHSPGISASVRPGQFINVRADDSDYPLLRRPFSVTSAERGEVGILFDVRGIGTRILSEKHVGDMVDIIGPLGSPYQTAGEFETALLVGGGLGVAPLPMVERSLRGSGKKIALFLGARTAARIVGSCSAPPLTATDDGSAGFRGTVVDLLRHRLDTDRFERPKIFGCGPNRMLAALAQLAAERNIPCEISLETPMACGVGLCQGCPVELAGEGPRYALVCRDGPVFDARTVRIG
jgi:dihydroorotate dehydrogenase electron transfer subunit